MSKGEENGIWKKFKKIVKENSFGGNQSEKFD